MSFETAFENSTPSGIGVNDRSKQISLSLKSKMCIFKTDDSSNVIIKVKIDMELACEALNKERGWWQFSLLQAEQADAQLDELNRIINADDEGAMTKGRN